MLWWWGEGMLRDMVRLILLLLFVGLPVVELSLLLRIGEWLGWSRTIALVLVTGVVGSSLAHQQGQSVLRRMQAEVAAGRTPGTQLGHGVMILVAGLLLITPGIITDIVGTLLLVPPVRAWIGRWLLRFLTRRFTGELTVIHTGLAPTSEEEPRQTKIIDARIIEDDARDDV